MFSSSANECPWCVGIHIACRQQANSDYKQDRLLHPWLLGAKTGADLWHNNQTRAYNLNRNGPRYQGTRNAFGAPLGD